MSELIDRQSALSVCKEYGWLDDEDFIDGYNTAIKDIREAIKELPATKPEQRRVEWIPCSERLPDMRTRVLVEAVRDSEHYPKDTEPSRMFIAIRIEMLSDGEWYWAEATDIYGANGIGGMLVLGGWKIVAWMPMPDAYGLPEKVGEDD